MSLCVVSECKSSINSLSNHNMCHKHRKCNNGSKYDPERCDICSEMLDCILNRGDGFLVILAKFKKQLSLMKDSTSFNKSVVWVNTVLEGHFNRLCQEVKNGKERSVEPSDKQGNVPNSNPDVNAKASSDLNFKLDMLLAHFSALKKDVDLIKSRPAFSQEALARLGRIVDTSGPPPGFDKVQGGDQVYRACPGVAGPSGESSNVKRKASEVIYYDVYDDDEDYFEDDEAFADEEEEECGDDEEVLQTSSIPHSVSSLDFQSKSNAFTHLGLCPSARDVITQDMLESLNDALFIASCNSLW